MKRVSGWVEVGRVGGGGVTCMHHVSFGDEGFFFVASALIDHWLAVERVGDASQ